MARESVPLPVHVVDGHYCWRTIGVYGDRSCQRLKEYVHCRNCPMFAGAAREALNRPVVNTALEEDMRISVFGLERRSEQRKSVLAFKLGAEWLGLDTHVLAEVATDRAARRIAHRAGGLIEGMVNIRGELQLCLALSSVLEIESVTPASRDRPRLVVAKKDNATWVFRAQHVRGVVGYGAGQLGAPPARLGEALKQHVLGIVRAENISISVLSTESVFEAFQRAVFE